MSTGTKRQQMGKVKLRVRESALRLRSFTVEQMIKATGCNPESVQSELRRMRKEGLLTVTKCDKETPQRGAPTRLYSLTNSESRLELASQLEDFFSKPQKAEEPTSQHFFDALKFLDQVEAEELDPSTQSSLLERAKDELEFAWYEEGEPKDSVEGHIKSQLGRFEYLQGNDDRAEALFRHAQQVFEQTGQGENGRYVREYLTALSIRRQLEPAKAKAQGRTSLVNKVQTAIATVQASRRVSLASHPINGLLLSLVEQLLSALRDSMRDLVLAEAEAQLARKMHQLPNTTNLGSLSRPDFPGSAGSPLLTLDSPGIGQAASAGRIAKPNWAHNSSDDYNYAFRPEPRSSIEYFAVNSPLSRFGNVSILKTAIRSEER
jgi:hypothetical protein